MRNRLVININKFKYDDNAQNLLSNLYIDLYDGDILWLSGAVGCGKTTLLKIIAGIVPTFESGCLDGEVVFNGERIRGEVLGDVAFCFQHSDNQLLFDTVYRQFFGEEREIKKFLKEVDIGDIASKSVMDLSRGQRKFVTLMSTLRKKRKIYIFDEPLDLLDPKRKDIVLKKLNERSRDSIVIISSHDDKVSGIATKKLVFDKSGVWKSRSTKKEKTLENLYVISKKSLNESIIEAKGLTFRFEGNNCNLDFPNINIFRDEILGIVGINGCGKTTFIRLLFESDIRFGGNVVRKFSNSGFMFQNVNRQLFANTVLEELLIGCNNDDRDTLNYAEYLLRRLGLTKFKNSHPTFLSGGQKQKLVFASLLMHKPEVLFLDEIFTNLDIDSINEIFKLISEYRHQNSLTLVLTDQSAEYLGKICDRSRYIGSA
jgi:energy-coupling factor transport system ATP-binding protein